MDILRQYRSRIDDLDDQIVDLLVTRTNVVREVGRVKFENDIPSILADRIDEVRERAAARADTAGLDADFVRQVYELLIGFSCRLEDEVKTQLAQDSVRK